MTNWEKYKDELLKIACIARFAKQNGIITKCGRVDCGDCEFRVGDCFAEREKWLDEEYVEPPTVEWSKVPVDTKVFVRDSKDDTWTRAHFAKYVGGTVYTYPLGRSSFTDDDYRFATETVLSRWNYAKLAEEEV